MTIRSVAILARGFRPGLMGGLIAGLVAAATGGAPARAGDDPVVIELYTSQGCSSCPPADALLRDLARRGDVLPLALHVDYWDYIGWSDIWGDPRHTARQRTYARVAGQRSIYTPQMIVQGSEDVVGFRPMELEKLIARHRAQADPVDLDVARDGQAVRIRATAKAPRGMVIQLVRFMPQASVAIHRGENAGRTLDYANVVTGWTDLARWDGQEPLDMSVTADGPAAVIVQAEGQGPILAAARAR